MTEWTAAELTIARLLVQDGKNAQQISDELTKAGFRRTHQAVRRLLQRKRATEAGWHAQIAASPYTKHTDALHIKSDAFLCLNDLHCPMHDAAFDNAAIDWALSVGCDTCVLGGDVVNFESFSFYGNDRPEVDAEAEIRATEQLLAVIAKEFRQVVWIAGNHEQRLTRRLGKALKMERAMQMFAMADNVQTSSHKWCTVECAGETWRVSHPGSRSRHATLVAKQLCSIHNTHVICGHGHLRGRTKDPSGRLWAVDSGVCCDPERLVYTMENDTTHPKMLQGAVVVKAGYPWVIDPEFFEAYDALKAA